MKKSISIIVAVLAVVGCGIGLPEFVNWTRYRATVAPLQSADDRVRDEAIIALKGGGPETVQVLGEALKDQNLRIRVGAARALGEFGPQALVGGSNPIPQLLEALQDPNHEVREAALAALVKIDPAAVKKK